MWIHIKANELEADVSDIGIQKVHATITDILITDILKCNNILPDNKIT